LIAARWADCSAAVNRWDTARYDIVAAHFAACAEDYLAASRGVGIERGWRVLDAGCGGGSFLPWLAEIVGPDGWWLAALDLAPESRLSPSPCAS
jgi:2-polyprenyl-3-methyl-5-hydroxy-6-metoxy-1,4-benzoquinol methylase